VSDIEIDPAVFRQVLGSYPTGVCAITALGPDGQPVGMVVGTFTSVSLDPPLVGFLPDKNSSTWPLIEGAGRFCVNALGADQQATCRSLAARGPDKFAGCGMGDVPARHAGNRRLHCLYRLLDRPGRGSG